MAFRFWSDLTTLDFAGLDPETTIAVVPVAATEQHGPHLPVSTDTTIAEHMIAETARQAPAELDILVLPVQSIGKSNEHLRSPGTLTLSARLALETWTELGECVHRAGLRKIVFVNSHGGNLDILNVVARELRVRLQMFAVVSTWRRLGLPPGMYTQAETEFGIHAGDIETSLMLHFRPDLVRMDKAGTFWPASREIATEFDVLRATGFSAFGWIAQDLQPSGAAGDASIGTAEKGKATAQFQAERFVALLGDVKQFELSRLA
jgi:creatinine amidohydrolase